MTDGPDGPIYYWRGQTDHIFGRIESYNCDRTEAYMRRIDGCVCGPIPTGALLGIAPAILLDRAFAAGRCFVPVD